MFVVPPDLMDDLLLAAADDPALAARVRAVLVEAGGSRMWGSARGPPGASWEGGPVRTLLCCSRAAAAAAPQVSIQRASTAAPAATAMRAGAPPGFSPASPTPLAEFMLYSEKGYR